MSKSLTDQVFFIRHKADEHFPADEIQQLKDKNKIAIFFDNEPLSNVTLDGLDINPKYFLGKKGKYKSALNCLCGIAKNGGMVVAEYNNDSEALIGQVNPGTRLESFGKMTVTLQLSKTQILKYGDYPVTLAARPPYVTICKPGAPFFQKIIPLIYNNDENNIKPDRSLLHHKALEQMCVEYLRTKGVNDQILKYCILRPGKSLAIIDIAGISKGGKKIYAQVKADKINPADHTSFINFVTDNIKETINIIFSKIDPVLKKHSDITYINVDDVFNYIKEKDENMVRNMIGFSKNT